jgi:hypothetical protein
MAISSASTRIFHAEDPVMQTDLELLAKVDQFKEEQFQEGEKQLQGEINNWSMLSNVAKPQDRQYINGKLVDLVNKVNSLGGVDLSDPNNVNSIKNLGYSLYGDQNILNAVTTTRRMNALSQDIYTKTNGKNAKDYDSVYGEYLQNQYSDWLSDGKTGTGYNGPTALPQGSFNEYQKKLQDGLAKLTPDLNEAPQGDANALNYYQIGDKFIKKERVQAFIDANTNEQDRSILNAHAWKGFQGYSDNNLLQLQSNDYNSKIKSLQDTWNDLQHQKALSKNNWEQAELYTKQMTDVQNSIDQIKGQKGKLPVLGEGDALPKEYRENLQSSLFNTAFKEDMSNAWAFDQKKTELKTNTAEVERVRMGQSAYQFGKMYDIHLAELGIKEKELGIKQEEATVKLYGLYGMMGLNGPAGTAPLSLVTTQGKDNATVVTNDAVQKADANYIKASTDFTTQSYNYLMSKDANLYGKFLIKDADGNWVPKDDRSTDILSKGIKSAVDLYGNIANMSVKERNGLKLSDDDQAFFDSSKNLKEAELYKSQIRDLSEQVYRNVGMQSPYSANITIRLKNGVTITKSAAELKEMEDRKDPLLDKWRELAKTEDFEADKKAELDEASNRIFKNGFFGITSQERKDYLKAKEDIEKKYPSEGFFKSLGRTIGVGSKNSVDNSLDRANAFYDNDDVKKGWENLSKTFNVYGAAPNLPKKDGKINDQLGKYLGGLVRTQHPEIASEVKDDDMDILKVYPVFDINKSPESPVKYIAEVRYRKGAGNKKDSGDKPTTIDLTDQVMRDHQSTTGGMIGNLFPSDNAEIVYGMLLNNKGATPLDPKDNYTSALQTHSSGLLTHKFQIVTMRNPSTQGVDSYRINVLIPKGKDQNGVPQFQTVPVINFDPVAMNSKITTYNFPANFKYATDYMDSWFQSSERTKEFYKLHGIPYNE